MGIQQSPGLGDIMGDPDQTCTSEVWLSTTQVQKSFNSHTRVVLVAMRHLYFDHHIQPLEVYVVYTPPMGQIWHFPPQLKAKTQ